MVSIIVCLFNHQILVLASTFLGWLDSQSSESKAGANKKERTSALKKALVTALGKLVISSKTKTDPAIIKVKYSDYPQRLRS